MKYSPSTAPSALAGPGERQFWRIANASADRYIDIQLDGQPFEIVALDGMPIAYHDPAHPTRTSNNFLVPPGGRLEAIVTGPLSAAPATLRSLCVDTGPQGDPNPGMVLGDVVPALPAAPFFAKAHDVLGPSPRRVFDLQAKENSKPDFVVILTGGQKRLLHQRGVVRSGFRCDACSSRGNVRTLALRECNGRTSSDAYSPGTFPCI